MKVIKPFKVGYVARSFEHQRSFYHGVGLLLYFAFDNPRRLLPEIDLWKLVKDELGAVPLDAGLPKSRAEFLVTGSAYSPTPTATLPVRVQVGALSKELYVIGDRRWHRDVPTAPEPFTTMPLGWERAFGGEGFAMNPLGRGVKPVAGPGGEVHPLPNVERPGRLVTSPGARPEPAGYGPYDFSWPQRLGKMGTYDRAWLEGGFPGFARDVDWTAFNLAPEDQQQPDAFRGDEAIVLENLHPSRPRIELSLPSLIPRCFFTLRDGSFVELPTRLTTVWLFPHRERGVLVFHGAQPVEEDDAADLQHALLAVDAAEAPRSIEHYREVLELRLDRKRALYHLLDDTPLVPPGNEGMGDALEAEVARMKPEGLLLANQRRGGAAQVAKSRAFLAELGLDPDAHGPTPHDDALAPPSDVTALPEYIRRVEEELATKRASVEAFAAERKEKLKALFESEGLDYAMLEEEQTWTQQGPPAFTAEGQREKLARLAGDVRREGGAADELDAYATSPEWLAQWKESEGRLRESYRQTAHLQKPAELADELASEDARTLVGARLAAGESLAGVDLTGADLRGMVIDGADLRGAFLESVRFDGASLRRANLEGAVLAHSVLTSAKLDGANLRAANLGGANLGRASTADAPADLTDAVLWRADLRDADLRGAKLAGAQLVEAQLDGADLSHADLSGAALLCPPAKEDPDAIPRLALSRVRFTAATLKGVTFIHADFEGVDFTKADLEGATFIRCAGSGAIFGGANMRNARFVDACAFEGADLRHAVLASANLRGTKLGKSDLSGADLTGADLSEADLSGARLHRVVAKGALFIRTDLREAFLAGANLMNAILQKADVSSADLRGANLFAADFARVRSDGQTRLEDAYQPRVRVHPKREA